MPLPTNNGSDPCRHADRVAPPSARASGADAARGAPRPSCARLTELGVPFVAGVGGHGVVATISRGESNRSVGLRADMDALPITETTGVPHASTNHGVMHACGHDGHTVSLLGAAALLARDPSWTGTVHLVFQPAEEGGGGAKSMIADGLFERFPMERIFGYHNWPGLEAGTVAVHDGPVMASGGRVMLHDQRSFRPRRAAASDARPDGGGGASAAGAANDRVAQRRSAGQSR